MTALRKPEAEAPSGPAHAPPPPRSIAETGLEPGFLIDLLVKTIYRMGWEQPGFISLRYAAIRQSFTGCLRPAPTWMASSNGCGSAPNARPTMPAPSL